MGPIELQEKLKKMQESIKENNIVDDLPNIVENLSFIVRDFPKELYNMDDELRTEYRYYIEYYRISFLAELVKQYMELMWKQDFSYEIVEGYLFDSVGGYHQKDDMVRVSVLGMTTNAENTSGAIKSFAHEFRHQQQYHFLKEKEFKDILNYPPYFITIIKNMLPKEIKTVVNEEGYVIDKPYYSDNYKRLYMEVDANLYGLDVSRTILTDLYELYPNKNRKLEKKINKLQKDLLIESIETENGLNNESRIDKIYCEEIRTQKPITSKVKVDDEEIDALLYTDICIKEEKNIKEKFPVLSIFMEEDRFKNYIEIRSDISNNIEKYNKTLDIENIYSYFIKSDPILLVTKYIFDNDVDKIRQFLYSHPTFKTEYKEEVQELIDLFGINPEIIDLLNLEDYAIMKKERVNL